MFIIICYNKKVCRHLHHNVHRCIESNLLYLRAQCSFSRTNQRSIISWTNFSFLNSMTTIKTSYVLSLSKSRVLFSHSQLCTKATWYSQFWGIEVVRIVILQIEIGQSSLNLYCVLPWFWIDQTWSSPHIESVKRGLCVMLLWFQWSGKIWRRYRDLRSQGKIRHTYCILVI